MDKDNKNNNNSKDKKNNIVNMFIILIGLFLLIFGIDSFFVKSHSSKYINEFGILEEKFFLIPFNYLLVLIGLIIIIVGIVKYLKK